MMGKNNLLAASLIIMAAAGCAHNKPAPLAPADVLYRQAVETAKPGQFLWWTIDHCDDAIPLYQRVVDNYPFSQYAVESQLGIADCYFSQEQWSDAVFHYRDFEKLHPLHPEIGRVRYRLGEAYHEQSLAYDLDTADLEQAYYYYSKTAEMQSPYQSEGRTKARFEAKRLARRILYIGRFYERNGESLAALERYRALILAFPDLPQAGKAYARATEVYKKLGEPAKIALLPRPRYGIAAE